MPSVRPAVLAISALAATACSLTTPPPLARIRKGPAFAAPPGRLLALPAACIEEAGEVCMLGVCAEMPRECHPGRQEGVEGAARMALEFAGLSLVDSELINARLGDRQERERSSPWLGAVTEVSLDVTRWGEASEEEREAVLDELSIDGFLESRLALGAPRGMAATRTVEVAVRIVRRSGELAWESRCSTLTGDHHHMERAIDLATRCAIDAALEVR
jgi:hypothetical protein